MIRVGTCSWTEKTLIKSREFYPNDATTAEARLRYYAGIFDTVEVDSTYYAIPDMKNTSLWVERTPGDFIFHVKAYGALTGHAIDPKTLPRDISDLLSYKDRTGKYVYIREPRVLSVIAERFKEALLPLKMSNKLGVLVFQFPPWFQYKTANFDYLLRCRELMAGFLLAVEFRHGSWLTAEHSESVVQFLRVNGLTYVTADEPQYGNLATVPFRADVTTDIAYFRFHGRNRENWLKKGIETSLRFAYHYSDEELKEFVPHLREAEKKTRTAYVMFNNCHGGFAMRNAVRMKEMVRR